LSRSIFYSFREGLDGFRRAKLASFIATITMSIALLLIGIFVVIALNLISVVESVRSHIEFEVFIDNALAEAGIQELRQQLAEVDGIAAVQFISREAAVELFKKEFGPADSKFLEVLENNPLPASFRITLKRPYQHSIAAQRIAGEVEKLPGVDEVVYRHDLLRALDRYVSLAVAVGFVLGLVVGLGAVVLVMNDVRLVIHAKRRIIETMQLVGATRAFVRRPFLVQGLLQGALGGLIASGCLYAIYRILLFEFGPVLRLPPALFAGLILGGMVLGSTASYFGARKYLR
jgi:cell division transport system permease protein